ncbi:MAG: energy-coupled thiamine transporter ThiT [Clostridia bacterium]|nr:energy-coupled thiamine transporter ThiT [Clostridia bacterium]
MSKTKKLTEIAVSVAMAVVCSFIKVLEMPQGGSVALTMIPLLFIAQKRGPLTGIIAGSIYGLLSALIAGVLYHPASLLLDYILAFGLLGIAGFFKNSTSNIVIGSFLGVGCRFLSSLISGAVLFAEYAPEGQNPWLYSLIYQSTYMVPEFLISICVLIFLYTKAHRLYEN